MWYSIKLIIAVILGLIGTAYLMRQGRKPSRWLGRPFLWAMNHSHSRLTDWGLSHVEIKRDFVILDVGCGGGRTIQKMAAIATDGKLCGVDYADGSVAASRERNEQLVKSGRVAIRQARVSQLPFADDSFDLVTAVETQYYWPDPPGDMREILRVLKPGGALLIIAENYTRSKPDRLQWLEMTLLKLRQLSLDEERDLFRAAGFLDPQMFEEPRQHWMCALGKKA